MDKHQFQHCFVDSHVHFYPSYDYSRAITKTFKKLKAYSKQLGLDGGVIAIIVLTERDDCSFYADLDRNGIQLGEQVKVTKLELGILIDDSENQLVIFPGRQINTKERVELLSLGSDSRIPSGLELAETISQIVAHQGFPVINWAPGKWWFKRGRLIRTFLNNSQEKIYLCDTSLRPQYYPRPTLMKFADSKGIPVLYGSDPLPHPDEQDLIFSYLGYYQQEFDLNRPYVSLKNLFQSKPTQLLGKRSSIFKLYQRLRNYYRQKGY